MYAVIKLGLVDTSFSRGLKSQNYFYHNTKMLFAFFVVLTFTVRIQSNFGQNGWCLTQIREAAPNHIKSHCIFKNHHHSWEKKPVSLNNGVDETVK